MVSKSAMVILLMLLVGCSHATSEMSEIWKVNSVSSRDFPVKPGMILTNRTDSLHFSVNSTTVSFAGIENQDRILLVKGLEKWLFQRNYPADSLQVWKELYSDHPLIIELSKSITLIKPVFK